MATPFPFTTGQVLTAAQMNSITELIINDKTDSYTLVAGDAGEYVVMNKATATTLTVPNSVFTAGQIVRIINKGAGVCTLTAGAGTTVSSTGTLALAQNAAGTLIALSASAFIYEAGGVTQSAGGLVYVTGATFTTATSVSLPANTFTSTYRNYRVFFETTAQTQSVALTLRLRSSGSDVTTARYFQGSPGFTFANQASSQADNATSSFTLGTTYAGSTYGQTFLVLDVISPQIAAINKALLGSWNFLNNDGNYVGRAFAGDFSLASGTQTYDSLSLISSVASSITGVYRVYGYADS